MNHMLGWNPRSSHPDRLSAWLRPMIAVIEAEYRSTAAFTRPADIRRGLLRKAHEALGALAEMEESSYEFGP
jgi:hypothetical protein